MLCLHCATGSGGGQGPPGRHGARKKRRPGPDSDFFSSVQPNPKAGILELSAKHSHAPPPPGAGLVSALAYGLAVVLLAWRFLSGNLHFDGALVGLMARDALKGDFHAFFFGNDYMGTLDSLLVAPALWLFGPSALVLNLYPPLFYLGTMIILHRLLGRFFPFWGVIAGLVYLALPPAYGLFWAGEARIHYLLALFLSALLMLLTTRMWEKEKISPGRSLAWGLVAGLAFWTHFLSGLAMASCGLFLLFTGWRKTKAVGDCAHGPGLLPGRGASYPLRRHPRLAPPGPGGRASPGPGAGRVAALHRGFFSPLSFRPGPPGAAHRPWRAKPPPGPGGPAPPGGSFFSPYWAWGWGRAWRCLRQKGCGKNSGRFSCRLPSCSFAWPPWPLPTTASRWSSPAAAIWSGYISACRFAGRLWPRRSLCGGPGPRF